MLSVAIRSWSGSSLAFPAVVLPLPEGQAVRIRAAGPPRDFADDNGSRQLAAAIEDQQYSAEGKTMHPIAHSVLPLLGFLLFLTVWFALVGYILPKLGIPT